MDKINTTQYDTTFTKKASDTQVNNNTIKFVVPNIQDTKDNIISDAMSFQDIQNKTLDELQSLYDTKETLQSIQNKYIATQFSSDINLSLTLFNQVSSMSDDESTSFLSNLFLHKTISLDSQTDSLQKGALLRKSIIAMIDDPDIQAQQEKIEKEFLSAMVEFDIMSHFNSMLDFGKSEKDKNKDSEYSFLYNNFYNQYDMLFNDYKNNKELNDMLINQYVK